MRPGAYLVFWGSEWQTGFTDRSGYTNLQAMAYMTAFFQGVGGSPWADVMSQYCQSVSSGTVHCPGSATFVGNPANQLLGTWIDAATPVPATPTDFDIGNEAVHAVNAKLGYHANANYLIFTPPGKSTAGFGSSFCAWHSAFFNSAYQILSFSNIPYSPDIDSCGYDFVNAFNDSFGHGVFDGYGITAGHEYTESVTDPAFGGGWFDNVSYTTGENGDKCVWNVDGGPVQTQDVYFGSQYFAMQPTWSNTLKPGHTGGCAMSIAPWVSPPPRTNPFIPTFAVSPDNGPSTGATAVTISGIGFTGATAVHFGANAAGFTVNNDSQITATSPAGTGTVDVTVTTPLGTSPANPTDFFSYLGAPTVTALAQTVGPAGGGANVLITGTSFVGLKSVYFGASYASVIVYSATSMSANTPAGTGTVDVIVTNAQGPSATSAASKFTYVALPTVTSVVPSVGGTGGGTSVTITGTDFTLVKAVAFGGTVLAPAGHVVNSATQITAISPPGSLGTVDVTVTAVGGTSAAGSTDKFTYIPPPQVTSVSPNSGTTDGGTSVTINGNGFSGATAVKFGANAAPSFTVSSDSKVTVTSPPGSGVQDVRVTAAGGTSAASAADKFTYIRPVCGSATLTSDKAAPQPGGTLVTFTATAAGCTHPQFEFWTWTAATSWVMRQAYSATNTWSLNTTGMTPGTITVDVWAEQAGSVLGTNNYETFGLEAWIVGGCDFASLAPNPAPTTVTVHFVASAGGTGCGTPLFQFYVYTAATGFVSQGPFSATNTLDVNTATLSSSSYTIDVWVKQQGSPLNYETWALSSIGNGGPCGGASSTTITPAQPTPQSTGTTVDFTTVTTGCTSPQYRYWLYPGAGGTWQMLQDYGVGSGVYHWNTTGLKPGTYSIVVHVRQATSTSTYDTYGALSYSVTGAFTSTLSGGPGSPQTAGTPVTLTATAPGSMPLYQFQVYLPGVGWTIAQDFSASPTYGWTTTGVALGTYAWVMFAKQNGSSNGSDSYALLSFSLT